MDPRAITYSAAVGYSISDHAKGPGSRSFDYGLDASFFPGMKISGNTFANSRISTIQSDSNIAGYNVKTNSYGGTVNVALGRSAVSGLNNNNNYSNNNNNQAATRLFSLPDISLTRTHTDTNSELVVNPQRETLDVTRATLLTRVRSLGDINIDGEQDEYHDRATESAYDTKSANLYSNLAVRSDANLVLTGHYTDRVTHNIAGYDTSNDIWSSSARLDFKEVNRFRQYYMYSYTGQHTSSSASQSQTLLGGANYLYSDTVSFQGSLNYATSEFTVKSAVTPSGMSPKMNSSQDAATLSGGVLYQKTYTPPPLNPFALHTRYGFSFGYSDYSATGDLHSGSGLFYGNDVGLGLSSTGWQSENLTLDYTYQNRVDYSPVHNNSDMQSFRLNFTSRRYERTTLRATANYTDQSSRNDTSTPFLTRQTSFQSTRTELYDAGADYLATDHLSLSAGVSRGETKSNASTLNQLQSSTVNSIDDQVYLAAAFAYPVNRHLQYSANARTEYHNSQARRNQIEDLSMKLDYRIRMVFLSAEARLREEAPSDSERTEQQYYFVKLTRPF